MEGCSMERKSDGDDKRKSPRIDFNLQVKVAGQKKAQEVKNFGLYGVFLQTDPSFQAEQGDEISLVMRLPLEDIPLELKGRIVRVEEEGVGVVFPDISPQEAMALEACFAVFKETLPLPGS